LAASAFGNFTEVVLWALALGVWATVTVNSRLPSAGFLDERNRSAAGSCANPSPEGTPSTELRKSGAVELARELPS
jgi:hypothetical protein